MTSAGHPDARPRSLSCQLPGPPLQWQLLVDDDVSSSKSPGNSPRNSFSSTGSGTSQTSGSRESKGDGGGGSQSSKAGLAKLARLLTPREKSVGERTNPVDDTVVTDISTIRKANSIDSLLETSSSNYNLDLAESSGVSPESPSNKPLPSSPSVPAKLESHKRGTTPTSPNMPNKLAKGGSGTKQGSMERLIDSGPLTKAEKKKLEKVNKFNIDLQGKGHAQNLRGCFLVILIIHYASLVSEETDERHKHCRSSSQTI